MAGAIHILQAAPLMRNRMNPNPAPERSREAKRDLLQPPRHRLSNNNQRALRRWKALQTFLLLRNPHCRLQSYTIVVGDSVDSALPSLPYRRLDCGSWETACRTKTAHGKSVHQSISALMTAFGIETRLRLCVCEFWQALSSLVNQIMQHPENCWFGYGRFEETDELLQLP